MKWERAGKKINVPLLDYLDNLIKEEFDLNHQLSVSVGTDSQRSGRGYKFATVILITVREDIGGGVTVGRGGKIISATYHMNVFNKNKEGVNERMLMEVSKSIEVAYEIASLLDSYGIKMEIHADINTDPKWESNKALSQAVGYIMGMGYEFKVKPCAFAASYCGDKYAK
jgi:predicted RNase H-related nuclease YkuK (DUF458 family)